MRMWIGMLLLLSSLRTQAVSKETEFYWFKKGLQEMEDADYKDAVEHFTQALLKADKLRDYSRFYRARSNLSLKNWDLAQKDLLAINEKEAHFKLVLESRLLLANVYFELKKPQLVKPLFARLLRRVKRTEDEPQVLMILAKAERLSDQGRGCRYLLEMYKRFPDFSKVKHWDADLDKNEFLGEPTLCAYSTDDFRDRMRALLWAGLDQKAYAEMILVSGRLKSKMSALSDVIRSQFHLQEGDVTRAYDLLKPHLETHQNDPEFMLNFAATASRAGDSSAAMGAYLHVANTQGKRSKWAQRAAFLAAVLSYQFQDYDGAEKRFSNFIKRYPTISLSKEARWHLAWVDYLRGNYERATSRFHDLVKKNRRSSNLARNEYWLAMSYLKTQKYNKARPIFQKLAQDSLRGYYALAAQARLENIPQEKPIPRSQLSQRWAWSEHLMPSLYHNEPAPVEVDDEEEDFTSFVVDEEDREQVEEETETEEEPTEVEPVELAEIKTPALARRLETAGFLQSLNLNEWAKWENFSIEKKTRNKDYLKRLISEYQKLDQFHRSSQIAHLSFAEERKRSGYANAKYLWESAYPRAYENAVEKWSSKESVPEEFIWAIMKQESQFKKDAISPVGALGLMQVMPMTGYKMSKLRGDTEFTPQNLLTPEGAIQMGSAYLKRLLRKFDNNYGLVAAAYNAGPHRADLWVYSFGHLSADEFIEHIPFAETRNYVKKVLSNMQVYRELYDGKKKPEFDLSAPFSYKIKGTLSLKEEWETP